MDLREIQLVANEIRQDVVRMIAEAGSGHPGGSLSCVDILCALYFGGVLNYDSKNPKNPDRDYFILSKGHAAPAFYATLARAGYFDTSDLMTLRKLGSNLQGHPDCNLVCGVEVSTGSLGQGLSIAAGCACGLKINDSQSMVFTVLGDGECEEGQVWEAAMFSAHESLDNLVAVIDRNGLQIDGPITSVCSPEDLQQKFVAFGWDVCEIDGHDIEALIDALNEAKTSKCGMPHAIIAKTIKGKGVSFMEDQVGWHGKAPDKSQLQIALADLEKQREVI